MNKFKILTSKFDVFYVLIINILPIFFYILFDWNYAEFFLYFLVESLILGLVLIFKDFVSIHKDKIGRKIFENIFIYIFYSFIILMLTSFFTEIGYDKISLNNLIYDFLIHNWYISILPIVLISILDIFNFYLNKEHLKDKGYSGILLGRIIVYFFLTFISILLLVETKNFIIVILYPVIVRLLYGLDGRIKMVGKLSPMSPFRFMINFFIVLFLIMYISSLFHAPRVIDHVASILFFIFLLGFRKLIYNFNKS